MAMFVSGSSEQLVEFHKEKAKHEESPFVPGSSEQPVEFLREKANHEESLLLRFNHHAEMVKDGLMYIHGFMNTARQKSTNNEVQEWMQTVQEVFYDAQDIFEECSMEISERRTSFASEMVKEGEIKEEKGKIKSEEVASQTVKKGEIKEEKGKGEIKKDKRKIEREEDAVEALVWRPNFTSKMVQRIEAVNNMLQAALETAKKLDLIHDSTLTIGSNYQPQGRMGRSYIRFDDSPTVGMESMIEDIVNLINGPGVQIKIVGERGMGKTLLMQHVFKKIKHTFELSIWVCYSKYLSPQNYQSVIAAQILESTVKEDRDGRQDILLQIVKGSVSQKNATAVIRDHLRETRCLVVLDGCFHLRHLLQRIGVTSYTFERGSKFVYIENYHIGESEEYVLYQMKYLSEDDQRKLFCLHAFPDCHLNEVPEDLKTVGHAIVEMCRGIPLAIKMTAASMAVVPRLPSLWEGKLLQLKELPDFRHELYEVIPPLSEYLQFFNFFAKDEDVDWEYLILLCKAEGYLYEAEDGFDHESSNSIVMLSKDLKKKCIIQLRQDLEKGFEKYCCRIYDFWRDFCISQCKENNWVFDLVATDSKGSLLVESNRCRRLSIPKMDIDIIPKGMKCSSALRSLCLAGNPRIKTIPAVFLSDAKALRVVDVSGTSITSLPKSVGQLKLIKVLNLSSTQIMELPRCIRGLSRLEFLDVSGCKHLHSLPEWISELELLKHLSMLDTTIGFSYSHLPRGLRIIRGLNSRPLKVEDAEHLSSLEEIQLRLEGDNGVLVQQGRLFDHIEQMKVLSLSTSKADFLLPSENMMDLEKLRSLRMEGYTVPSWLDVMDSLCELRLCSCKLEPFPGRILNLQILELDDNGSCKELPLAFGKSRAFPRLRWLKISRFTVLTQLPRLKYGAMERLEYMKVEMCSEVEELPEGLDNLHYLKELSVVGSHKLVRALEEGSDGRARLPVFARNVIKIHLDKEKVELYNPRDHVSREVETSASASSSTYAGTQKETSPSDLSSKVDEYSSKD